MSLRAVAFFAAMTVVGGSALPAQGAGQSGPVVRVDIDRSHGFAAIPVVDLAVWGWRVEVLGDSAVATGPGGRALRIRSGTPFARLDAATVQFADAPYRLGGGLYVPVQLLQELSLSWRTQGAAPSPPSMPAAPDGTGPNDVPDPVVIIDAGHGGRDLGALGYGGTREKDVALAVALALARRLESETDLRVHLLRDSDDFVPLWERGGRATSAKGEAPGVFLSIHANSHPTARDARGFETFFLAEARTDHERRISALENESESSAGTDGRALLSADLDVILGELRNADYQHWSAHLATLIQASLAHVHPGPNRGVSQAPLAAITTSLMPSVLVELGFVTNAEEEVLLNQTEFHSRVAEALVQAVVDFFEGYPPLPADAGVGNRP